MSDPLSLGGKMLSWLRKEGKYVRFLIRNSGVVFAALILLVFGSVFRLWGSQPVFYAHAYSTDEFSISESDAVLFNEEPKAFCDKKSAEKKEQVAFFGMIKKDAKKKENPSQFAQKIYDIVGETPIKEMVPFISKRDEKVAAFLVGIAKKESSWGEHVPLQNGKDCYNYWGYKGSASRGSALGYACFADAEEAIKVVGDRIEVLIGKDHNTPSKMLVWKCGSSCAGHSPEGVKSWVATVAMYLEKIVG